MIFCSGERRRLYGTSINHQIWQKKIEKNLCINFAQPISRVDSGYPKRSLISNGIVFKSYVTAFAIVTRAKCFAKIISVSEKNKSRKYNWPPVYIVNIFDICIYT